MGLPAWKPDSWDATADQWALLHVDLTPGQFQRVSNLLHCLTGIHLQPGKEQLVRSRLWKRIHILGLASFDEYLDLVESGRDAQELTTMVDSLSTNETSFFRESAHFDFLRSQLHGWFRSHDSLRIWSAGCSSGEEPYTIAMVVLKETYQADHRRVRILATDVSTRTLREARAGEYTETDVGDVPPDLRRQFFFRQHGPAAVGYEVTEPIRNLVSFARLNLIESWPMRGPFDFIFCRNVMIYFTRETQDQLVRRFRELLAPGGYLLIGHSESLTGRDLDLTYVMPATYRK